MKDDIAGKIADEVNGLYFVDDGHKDRLVGLMSALFLEDTLSPWFVSLYLVSALTEKAYEPVTRLGLGEDFFTVALKTKDPLTRVVMKLARALSPLAGKADILETFEALSKNRWFKLGLCAVDLHWELCEENLGSQKVPLNPFFFVLS